LATGWSSVAAGAKLVGDASEGVVQVPALRGVFRSGRAQAPDAAVLPEGTVPDGKQGRESAAVAEEAGERGLLPWHGERGTGADMAEGEPGVLA
jgi:hypothetical protein